MMILDTEQYLDVAERPRIGPTIEIESAAPDAVAVRVSWSRLGYSGSDRVAEFRLTRAELVAMLEVCP
jgi:hypothetical protein